MSPNLHLVITIHGIRTYGQWQPRLKKLLEDAEPGITVLNEKYGYFSILAFLFPPTRWLVTRRFRQRLLDIVRSKPWSRIDLVGHSFGTHLIGWGLHGIAAADRPQIHTVVLAGSVLKSRFHWEEFIGKSIKRLVNECGTKDGILVLNQMCVLFTGMAGRIGFYGLTGDNFQNRYYQFGHSDYFVKDDEPYDEFMRAMWVPLLTSDGPIQEIDNRQYLKGWKGALEGVGMWALNNAEPIKLTITLSIFIAVVWWITGLYLTAETQRLEAERQRDLAYTTESKFFADLARQKINSDAVTAALIAIEGMPDASAGISRPLVIDVERQLYDAIASQRERYLLRGPTSARSVQNLSNQQILGVFDDDSIRVWSIATGQPHLSLSSKAKEALVMAPSADGRRIVTVSEDHVARIWDTDTGRVIREIPGVSGSIDFALSRDDRYLATVSQKTSGDIWDFVTGRHLVTLNGPIVSLSSLAFNDDASLIVGVNPAGTPEIWDVKSGTERTALDEANASTALFIPKGEQIVVRDKAGRITLFHAQTGRRVSSIEPDYDRSSVVEVSQDGTRLIVSSESTISRYYHIIAHLLFDPSNPNKEIATIEKYDDFGESADYIRQIALNASAKRIIGLQGRREAILFDWSGTKITSFPAWYVTFSRDKQWIVSVSAKNWVEIRNTENGALAATISFGDRSVNGADIDNEAEDVFTAGQDGTIRAWKYKSLSERSTLDANVKIYGDEGPGGDYHGGEGTLITGLQFSPDGEMLATASAPVFDITSASSRYGDVSIWDLHTGKRLASAKRDPRRQDRGGDVVTPIFSNDDKRVLIQSGNYPPIVWRWQAEPFKSLDSKAPEPTPDDTEINRDFPTPKMVKVIIRKSDDGLVVEDESGRRFPVGAWTPKSGIALTAVSPDFQSLAVADGSGLVKVLRLFPDSPSLLAYAKLAMPRCLTPDERKRYNMAPIPPRWCITGAGREKELDSTQWSGVWPYDTNAFRDWLVAADKARSRHVSPLLSAMQFVVRRLGAAKLFRVDEIPAEPRGSDTSSVILLSFPAGQGGK